MTKTRDIDVPCQINMYNLEEFGNRVRGIREDLKLSQRQVAEKTYISIKTIRRIELGQVLPDLATLDSLSAAYHEDLAELLLLHRTGLNDSFYEILLDIKNSVLDNDVPGLIQNLSKIEELREKTENDLLRVKIIQLEYFYMG